MRERMQIEEDERRSTEIDHRLLNRLIIYIDCVCVCVFTSRCIYKFAGYFYFFQRYLRWSIRCYYTSTHGALDLDNLADVTKRNRRCANIRLRPWCLSILRLGLSDSRRPASMIAFIQFAEWPALSSYRRDNIVRMMAVCESKKMKYQSLLLPITKFSSQKIL